LKAEREGGADVEDRRPVGAIDAVSTLSDRDEDALEAIRRQLDMEFPHALEQKPWERDGRSSPEPAAPSRHRTAMVGGAMLLAFVAGGGAGVLVTVAVLDSRTGVSPTLDRVALPPPATVTRPSPPARRTPARARIEERPAVSPMRATTAPDVPAPPPAAPPAPVPPVPASVSAATPNPAATAPPRARLAPVERDERPRGEPSRMLMDTWGQARDPEPGGVRARTAVAEAPPRAATPESP
jgi:hypothetical protein